MKISPALTLLGALALTILGGCSTPALLVNDVRNASQVDTKQNGLVCFSARAKDDLHVSVFARHVEGDKKYKVALTPDIDQVNQVRVFGKVVSETRTERPKLGTDLVLYQLPAGHYVVSGVYASYETESVTVKPSPATFEVRAGEVTYLGDFAAQPKRFLFNLTGVKLATFDESAAAKASLAAIADHGIDKLPVRFAPLGLTID
jgi:hypothetical protein